MTKMFFVAIVSAAACLAVGSDTGMATVTLVELLAKPAQYLRTAVAVEGQVVPGPGLCTKMACTEETPCCNNCSAQPYLVDGNQQILLTTGNQNLAAELLCSWRDCEPPACRLFVAGTRYEVEGIVSKSTSQSYYLDYSGATIASVTPTRNTDATRIATGHVDENAYYDVRGRRILSGEAVRGVCLSSNGVRRYVEPRQAAVRH